MTPRGRKPLPTKIKKLHGTFRADRAVPNEPKVPAALPEPPDWLAGDALAEWRRLAPQLMAAGLLTRLDRAALASYCSAWGDLCSATRVLAEQGTCYTNDRGALVVHPLLRVVERSRQSLRAFAAEFGLSPSARSRVGAATPRDAGDADDARRFFPLVNRGRA